MKIINFIKEKCNAILYTAFTTSFVYGKVLLCQIRHYAPFLEWISEIKRSGWNNRKNMYVGV